MCNIPAPCSSTWFDCNRYLRALLDEFCSQGTVENSTDKVQLYTRDDSQGPSCDARHMYSAGAYKSAHLYCI
ncbi:hypothetical protein DPMN_049369 [Dreissena polymorpha]|uniref:Uncharacterized protein n=1 Tax=Dreissena polymorpha TaxID=45954 RepID=A0A9D4CFG3_DREPO|nr:hypothetical protein DPMN_049369 [Dreissena polymorpha]